jgi:hypothetical protein
MIVIQVILQQLSFSFDPSLTEKISAIDLQSHLPGVCAGALLGRHSCMLGGVLQEI